MNRTTDLKLSCPSFRVEPKFQLSWNDSWNIVVLQCMPDNKPSQILSDISAVV